jgi:hypothetical protein
LNAVHKSGAAVAAANGQNGTIHAVRVLVKSQGAGERRAVPASGGLNGPTRVAGPGHNAGERRVVTTAVVGGASVGRAGRDSSFQKPR